MIDPSLNTVDTDPVRVSRETFDRYESLFPDSRYGLEWECPFVLPFWIKSWQDAFLPDMADDFFLGWHGEEPIGAAALMSEGTTMRFRGAEDVCDFQDITLAPTPHKRMFLERLLLHLRERGVRRLELGALRPDAAVLDCLPQITETAGHPTHCEPVGRSYEMALPGSWDAYLDLLSGKQRHEVRRKIRRLNEAGRVSFRVVRRPEEVDEVMPLFLAQFRTGGVGKAQFMTRQRTCFFRSLVMGAAVQGVLRLGMLNVDRVPAATVLCFDHRNTRFLYNNGYDPRFRGLSVGVLSKVFSIKDAIETGLHRYDFLRGDEAYKRQLGGREVRLYKLVVDLEG